MSLSATAIITDPEEVWAYLSPTQQERTLWEPQMERWINGASALLERMCNRPIVARDFDIYQDGNGRRTLYLEFYPVLALSLVEVFDWTFNNSYIVDHNNRLHLVADYSKGLLTITGLGNPGHFLKGRENVHVKYRAGYEGHDLAPFQDAVRELIAERWKQVGQNPMEQQRSDSINSTTSFLAFDPRRIPHIVHEVVQAYRKLES